MSKDKPKPETKGKPPKPVVTSKDIPRGGYATRDISSPVRR
jgi:hypothetical protein